MPEVFGQESWFNSDVFFYGNVNIKSKLTVEGSITALEPVVFDGDVSFSKNITVDDANISGSITVDNVTVTGKLNDGNNSFGAAGQVLSSNGTNLTWINTSDANVGSATSVGINQNEDNANQFVTFVQNSSGNNPLRVDAGLVYNPSSNALTAGSFVRNGGTSAQFLKADGTVDTTVYGAQRLTITGKTSAYILAAGDVSTIISITTGGVTVPSGVFNAGDTVLIYNNSSASQTITQGASTTLRLPGTADTGDRTLQQRGLATVLCIAANEFLITGSGLL